VSETRELTATATAPSPDPETGGRVLVVCRSPELRLYIQKSLAVGELDSTTVVDLGEARDLLSSGAPFRAVLVELDDPLPPGAAKALERFCGDFRAATVVGIAPKPSAELVRDAMAGGVQDFLTNPFNTREMAQALRRALETAPRRAPRS
jgi:DNA-binding NtrC family response regulator